MTSIVMDSTTIALNSSLDCAYLGLVFCGYLACPRYHPAVYELQLSMSSLRGRTMDSEFKTNALLSQNSLQRKLALLMPRVKVPDIHAIDVCLVCQLLRARVIWSASYAFDILGFQ